MTLFVNDKPHEAPDAPTLFTTLEALALTPLRGIAVAVNDEVVARPDWPDFQLRPQDRITVIRATQGG
ncbi:sulfur carrier protein ThiS [Hymenobacter sediminis]|uniref:sulfur carrier protein ThiS n=1 Tax=Hymenobacter TaxID=89966 RepID=UPI000DA6599E|nr:MULTISPECIES: sulfur carrier protein ThiS [Hymenobacter]MBX0291569.1 sulfur carrier protein ThiS [Hymenobacter sp. HSC-4F20]RPD49559.1 sulfur carrier protein ThiS [Hymenobacter sediminis]